MDQASRKERILQKTKFIIAKMSLEELSYTLGRYCGPSNNLLCEKEFGFILDKTTIEERIFRFHFEQDVESLLLSDTES